MRSHTKTNSTPNHHNDASCLHYALFFHNMAPELTIFASIIFAVVSCIITAWIRSITPGIKDTAKSTAAAESTPITDIEATAIPDAAITSEDPPPYQPPVEASSASVVSPPEMTKVKQSSAQLFVMGTGLLLASITCLFLSALAVQALIFCSDWSPVGVVFRVIYWVIFAMHCCWASVGASCWLMLLRNLWGPGMRKRFPISESTMVIGLFAVIFAPFMLVGYIVGGGAVKAVEACQKKFCGDALEEELEEESVELEEGLRMEDGAEGAGGGGSREEERAGLMSGIEK